VSAAYRIVDEPRGGRTQLPAFNPFWPLLAMMFGGAWLGVAIFAFNAWSLRSPTLGRELALAIAILLGAPILLLLLSMLPSQGLLPESAFKYALLLIVAWKLGLAYWIFFLQQNPYALYEYFEERTTSNPRSAQAGAAIVVIGGLFKSNVVGAIASPFWAVMVS
jgi:hypothetical protein